jgi:hypothetical protein
MPETNKFLHISVSCTIRRRKGTCVTWDTDWVRLLHAYRSELRRIRKERTSSELKNRVCDVTWRSHLADLTAVSETKTRLNIFVKLVKPHTQSIA